MASTFGERLKQVRLEKNLSQEELAALLGTSKQVISRYETNQRTPKVTVANEYAEKLHVQLGFLLGDDMTKNDRDHIRNFSNSPKHSEISGVYLSFAKDAQDKGIDPDDIRLAIETIEKLKKKK